METPREHPEAERQLGRLEGRIEELSASFKQLRSELLQIRSDLTSGLTAVNSRIDRLLLANIALGGGLLAGLIGLIATLIVRGT